MTTAITAYDLMTMTDPPPMLDVRTPVEFTHGHMPGACNIPLFSNEERVQVGTTYKKAGREAAILLGFDLTGPKWSGFIRQALEIAPHRKVAVHCWRGGMRSAAMAWALDLYGFDVYLVTGGYKAYRRWVQDQCRIAWNLRVIGGMTGSGKTRTLQALRGMGEQVLDLEALAQHQGSVYGTMNRLTQPSQEQFENNLAAVLHGLDEQRRIWVEDESIAIGQRLIPRPLWDQLQTSVLFDLQVPVDQRIGALVQEYGPLDKDFLVDCTARLRKRMGTELTKNAIAAILADNMPEFIRLVLVYYDKMYRKGLNGRVGKNIFVVPTQDANEIRSAKALIHLAEYPPVLPGQPASADQTQR